MVVCAAMPLTSSLACRISVIPPAIASIAACSFWMSAVSVACAPVSVAMASRVACCPDWCACPSAVTWAVTACQVPARWLPGSRCVRSACRARVVSSWWPFPTVASSRVCVSCSLRSSATIGRTPSCVRTSHSWYSLTARKMATRLNSSAARTKRTTSLCLQTGRGATAQTATRIESSASRIRIPNPPDRLRRPRVGAVESVRRSVGLHHDGFLSIHTDETEPQPQSTGPFIGRIRAEIHRRCRKKTTTRMKAKEPVGWQPQVLRTWGWPNPRIETGTSAACHHPQGLPALRLPPDPTTLDLSLCADR